MNIYEFTKSRSQASATEVIYLPPEANIGSEVPAGPGPRQDLQGVAHHIPPYSALPGVVVRGAQDPSCRGLTQACPFGPPGSLSYPGVVAYRGERDLLPNI
ncbi:uncharacterized protein CC84DRAFT_1164344, partial [Paraphaeosphaeria sporulosa]